MNHRHHWETQKEFRRLFRAVNSAEKHARKLIALLAEHSELKPSLTDEQLGQLHECRLFLSCLATRRSFGACLGTVQFGVVTRSRNGHQCVQAKKNAKNIKEREDHAAGRGRL